MNTDSLDFHYLIAGRREKHTKPHTLSTRVQYLHDSEKKAENSGLHLLLLKFLFKSEFFAKKQVNHFCLL